MGDQEHSIAVVGLGVSGLSAAYQLNKNHRVSVFEKNDYLGGHTNTIVVSDPKNNELPVDTGFIVFNDRNYPTFTKLLNHLGIIGQASDMSFGFHDEANGFCYSSYVPGGLFASKRSLIWPKFYSMVSDILKFNERARRDLESGQLEDESLGDYLARGGYGQAFRSYYLLPMGAAIWSTPTDEMLGFPAKTFLRFFDNHGLLQLKDRPHWMTVPGGSHSYVKKIRSTLRGEIRVKSQIKTIMREQDRATLCFEDGSKQSFDYVIIATHADEALQLLDQPTNEEQMLLGAWRYNQNEAILHTDDSLMPPRKKAWASWNYHLEKDRAGIRHVSLTYDMNRLQSLDSQKRYFVTLNRRSEINEEKVIRRIDYTHPMYTRESVATQSELPRLNGKSRVFFCGSYFGYGFHEDAVKSANQVLEFFGATL